MSKSPDGGVPPQPTLRDVARVAGVSITTVSLVLSGRAQTFRISDACSQRVIESAKQLNYRRHNLYRAQTPERVRTVGMLTGHPNLTWIDNFYFGPMIAGVELGCRLRGYDMLLIGNVSEEANEMERATRMLEEHRVDAVVLISINQFHIIRTFAETPLPVVCIGRHAGLLGHPQVVFDPVPGITAAAEHLAQLGHRRLLLVVPLQENGTPQEAQRLEIWRTEAARLGLAVELMTVPRVSVASSVVEHQLTEYTEAFARLSLPAGTTAIVAFNDLLALGIISVCNARGIRIPQDLSLIGFDNQIASMALPALTSISHCLVELGLTAANIAVDKAEGRPPAQLETVVPAVLVERASTGPART
jgi:DNA-binding LacI/PurR family transcriptional regulator